MKKSEIEGGPRARENLPGPSTPQQLSLLDYAEPLPPGALRPEAEFIAELQSLLKDPMAVRLTRNRSTLISIGRTPAGREARIQHAFRAADRTTVKALAQFLHNPTPHSRALVDEFIRDHYDLIEAMAREAPAVEAGSAKGAHRDLTKIMANVMRDYGFRLPGMKIQWSSRRRAGRGCSSIRFGSYCRRAKTIRIHPDLDQPDVPEFFVEYIVYHELLHALFPPTGGQRRQIHGAEFKRFEKKFRRFEEALHYEKHFVRTKLK
jgi:hypothetical protein